MPSTNSQLEEHYVDSITRMFLAKEPEFLSSNPDEPWYRIRVKWNKFALIKRKSSRPEAPRSLIRSVSRSPQATVIIRMTIMLIERGKEDIVVRESIKKEENTMV